MSFHPKILTLLYMMEKMLTKTNTHSVILTWSHEKFSIINETSPKKDNWSGLITYELVAYRKKPINRDYACKRKHVLKCLVVSIIKIIFGSSFWWGGASSADKLVVGLIPASMVFLKLQTNNTNEFPNSQKWVVPMFDTPATNLRLLT